MDRIRRVNRLVQETLGDIFERELRPYLDTLVTITRVETSPDLRFAHVYLSVYGEEEAHQQARRVLRQREREIVRTFSRQIRLKYTPKLSFFLDESVAEADRVLRILDEIDQSSNDKTS